MSSRGQKRTDVLDELPADKRACSSLEFKPTSSNSSAQTPQDPPVVDMDTLSSTSSSNRSEGEGGRESAYGSCDSDNGYPEYYHHQSPGDQTKLKKVLTNLTEEVEESGQLALLTELCEVLSFCSDGSISSLMVDSLLPLLVSFSQHVSNPEIMLLSIRAMTYLCDVNPRASSFLVKHEAVPALCHKLTAIEYLDVAEQCLQALEKISSEQPVACLQSGAIMAVLCYIDFFSTSVQRVALSTVVNICKKLSSESPSLFMEAVPILCNLLQYEDRQIVQSVSTCLIRIGEQVCLSSDMLDEICKHGLVQHIIHLIGLNSRTTLCQPIYIGLIGLLTKLAAGSTVAYRTLLELNISHTVKDVLSTFDLSCGTLSTSIVDAQHNQVLEVLKLLNEILPTITAEQDNRDMTDKEAFLLDSPDILHKFGVDLLPTLIQVVNSGMNLFICYGCLSVINKLVHFSPPDALPSLLQTANFSSFLGGIFSRKDHHLILLALQIVDTTMLKLPHVYLNPFNKEGVIFAIYALLSPDYDMKPSPLSAASRDVYICPCIAFDISQSSRTPVNGTCKLQKDTVQNLAKHTWTSYFETESVNPEKGVTDILQKLRTLSTSLTALVNKFLENSMSSEHEDEMNDLLQQTIAELSEKDSISTFEFVESGIIKSLVHYLTNVKQLVQQEDNIAANKSRIMEKRFEVFGRLLLSNAVPDCKEFPLLTLTRRLQSALSSVENFPVISDLGSKRRYSYATVPCRRSTSYPCLKVQFVREDDELHLSDYVEDYVNVDPFVPLAEIEEHMWSIVKNDKTKKSTSVSHSPSDSNVPCGKSADAFPSEMLVDGNRQQAKESNSFSSPAQTSDAEQQAAGLADIIDIHTQEETLEEDGDMNIDHSESSNSEVALTKLLFCLEGQQLSHELSLYQSILKQKTQSEHDIVVSPSLWTRVYKITYRRRHTPMHVKQTYDGTQCPLLSKRATISQFSSEFSLMIDSDVDIEKLDPTYDILFLLKSLESLNRLRFHLASRERTSAFAEGKTNDLYELNVVDYEAPQNEFVNKKLSEKLEQLLRDPVAFTVGSLPAWCTQLVTRCPFLFSFEVRSKFFQLAALGRLPGQTLAISHGSSGGSSSRQQNPGNPLRKKILVDRNKILESAALMMQIQAYQKFQFEVEYTEEVGTGLGPTLEFYTLVCREFQRSGFGMWRDDFFSPHCTPVLNADNSGFLVLSFGIFPQPWSPLLGKSNSTVYSEVDKRFFLLGQVVAKALQDGRLLDLPFSKAFYKLILGKELTLYDIQSFDPAFGKALLEFQAVLERRDYLMSLSREKSRQLDMRLRNTRIEDLCLDFTLPGYPDYDFGSDSDSKMVNIGNLEEYIALMVDATTKSGIARQVKAFKSGFDQVFPIRHLKVFTEDELERLLCGEHLAWNSDELVDHIKIDHGYTISSPPIIDLLSILKEFDPKQQRSFLQFVTGAPRLPTGGLASLNPKLTIVRKHCGEGLDADLPSVMTCANYLKLPPYSSKEIMKEKLLLAITEGQGSFHLS